MLRLLTAIAVALFAALPLRADECGAAFKLLAWSGSDDQVISGERDLANYLREPVVTSRDIVLAQVVMDYSGTPAVEVQMTPEAGARFEKVTAAQIGKPIAIVVDGRVSNAPIVMDKIAGGSVTITGGFSTNQANALKESFEGCAVEQEKQ